MRNLQRKCSLKILAVANKLEKRSMLSLSANLLYLLYRRGSKNKEHFFKSMALKLEAGKNTFVVNCTNKYLKVNPNSTRALALLGVAYRNQKDYEKAIKAHQKCLKANNQSASSHYSLGLDYEKMGKRRTAKRYYTKAIELDSSYSKAYFRLATMYMEEKKYDLAVNLYLDGLSLSNNRPAEWINLALCYMKSLNNNAAEKVLTEAKKKFPMSQEILLALGLLYIEKKNLTKVDEVVDHLRKLDDDESAFTLALKKELELSNYNKARYILSKVKRKRTAYYWYISSIINANIGNEKKAIKQLRRAIKLMPDLRKTAKMEKHFYQLRELVEFKHIVQTKKD